MQGHECWLAETCGGCLLCSSLDSIGDEQAFLTWACWPGVEPSAKFRFRSELGRISGLFDKRLIEGI